MSSDLPQPWTLSCAWCAWAIEVNPRGAHGLDQGAGVAAAVLMAEHVEDVHGRTWLEFLDATE